MSLVIRRWTAKPHKRNSTENAKHPDIDAAFLPTGSWTACDSLHYADTSDTVDNSSTDSFQLEVCSSENPSNWRMNISTSGMVSLRIGSQVRHFSIFVQQLIILFTPFSMIHWSVHRSWTTTVNEPEATCPVRIKSRNHVLAVNQNQE